jgi:OPA family glycerol-3-phosphate transporter-like MFS transporter
MVVEPKARLARWQALTVGLMVTSYTGYYLCRSNLSVALPLIADDLAARGIDPAEARVRLGTVVSLGTFGYALGKFVSGGLADAMGGRRNVLIGMAGSVACTLLFASGGGLPLFTAAWFGNRLVQSLGWVGMVKITARWFSYSTYGTVMGILSLSYLFGDAASRAFMGWLIRGGLGWRGVFVVASAVLLGLFVVSAWLLKEAPDRLGLEEPEANPSNVYGAAGSRPAPPGLAALLVPLVTDPGFLVVCALSLGVTLLRETFNTWTPTYFVEGIGLSHDAAASRSALFPMFGGVSVLLAGFWGDRVGRVGRAAVICGGLFLAGAALAVLGLTDFGGSAAWPIGLVAAVGFLLIGPYSYLAGAIALDFGGKQGSATASGLIDGVGYLGGILAGRSVARISVSYGWHGAFTALAGVAWLSCLVAALFLLDQRRGSRNEVRVGA